MIKSTFRWFRIIGLVLFVWIIFQIDWTLVWLLIKEVRPIFIAGYFIIFITASLLKVIRMYCFLCYLGHRVAFSDVYQAVIEPAFFGMVTPARIGEFSKIVYLTRFGLSQTQAWCIVLMERLVDFSLLLITSIAGSLYFFIFGNFKVAFTLIMVFLMLSAFIIFLLKIKMIISAINGMFSSMGCHQARVSKLSSIGELLGGLGKLSVMIFLPISLLVLILSFIELSLLAKALNVNISGLFLGLSYACSSLIALLPFSVGGLGARETIYIALFHNHGFSSSIAIGISLLDGLLLPLIAQLFLFLPIMKMQNDKTRVTN